MRPMEVKNKEDKKQVERPGKMKAMGYSVSAHWPLFHQEPQRDTGWCVCMAPKAFFGELTGETIPNLSRNTLALLAGILGE